MGRSTFKIYATIFAVCIAIPALVSAQSERWVYTYDGSAYGSDDQAFSLVYGADGNIYSAGYSQDISGNSDFTVVSLTSGGSERWVYKYNGTANAGDQARKVVYGADSNVYAVGYTTNAATGSTDFAIISLTSTGGLRWIYQWDASHDGGADDGYDIVYGADGNIYAAGYSQSIDWPGWGRDPWITVISLDTSGTQRWVYSFDTIPPNSQWGMMHSIVYGNDGNIYTTGVIDQGTYLQYNYFSIISFTAAGAVRWNYLNSLDNTCGYSIVYGSDDYLYAGGYLWHGGGVLENFGVIKVSTTGSESWAYDYDAGYSDICNAVAYGLDGNIYAAGRLSTAGNNSNLGVVSLNQSGGLRWMDSYNGPGQSYDNANALAYGSDGMIYVAGSARDTLPFYDRFTVMMYDTAGNRQGRYWYVGSDGGFARAIACSADSNIYVAGTTLGDSYEFTVISLDTVITGIADKKTVNPVLPSLPSTFPTFFRKSIALTYTGATDQPVLIKILNSTGNVVYARSFDNPQRTLILDDENIGALPSGVYFFVISSGQKEVTKNKLVKIK